MICALIFHKNVNTLIFHKFTMSTSQEESDEILRFSPKLFIKKIFNSDISFTFIKYFNFSAPLFQVEQLFFVKLDFFVDVFYIIYFQSIFL